MRRKCMLGWGKYNNLENYAKNITLSIALHFSAYFHFLQWPRSLVVKGMVSGVRFPEFQSWCCDSLAT